MTLGRNYIAPEVLKAVSRRTRKQTCCLRQKSFESIQPATPADCSWLCFCTTNRVDALPSQDNDEPPSSHQRAATTSQSCRKITEPTAAQGRSTLFTFPDVLPPDASGRFTQSECPLGQLQIVCCKRHQMFGLARLSTLLCEPYVRLAVDGLRRSRMMTAAIGKPEAEAGWSKERRR